jgi:long-chain acyl-CoA synthetase
VVTIQDRNPESICMAIEKYKVQVLPTSPTFINLMLLSGCHRKYDLSSLELITYGTEVMQVSTLARLHDQLPNVKISQTYGLSEIGILRAKSKSSDSLYMKVGGEGFETRIVDGLLEIKAASAMLGYLNAESPFTVDGWFKTGDAVEVDGDYLRVLGRKSEMINVGGEKVYPAEVESVIQLMEGVSEVAVISETHPLIGQIVKAMITLSSSEDPSIFKQRLRHFCKSKLAPYKVPQKIILSNVALHNTRFKKIRKNIIEVTNNG